MGGGGGGGGGGSTQKMFAGFALCCVNQHSFELLVFGCYFTMPAVSFVSAFFLLTLYNRHKRSPYKFADKVFVLKWVSWICFQFRILCVRDG